MRSLRIAQLHWGFPPIIGGVETHLTILLPEIVKAGHKVWLLTGSVKGEHSEVDYKGVKVIRTPLMDLNWLYKRGLVGIEDSFMSACSDFLNRAKPDIVHVHNMNYFSRPHAYVLKKLTDKLGIPLILTAHNSWDDELFLELTTKIDWSRIIAVSHYIKRQVMGIGYDDTRISVVHHGVDVEKFERGRSNFIIERYPELKGKKIVFHPARMSLAKGCDVSVKAFREVVKRIPDACLVLSGTKNIIDWGTTQEKDIAYILYLIDTFGLRKNIFVNVFSPEEMVSLYALSSVCIYPSAVPEPFGLTMLESMASAKPTIVTNMGGMPEVIEDNINGFVIPPKDHETLASRIIQLLEDEKTRKRLGNTGREIAENSYTREIMTKNTLKVYENAL